MDTSKLYRYFLDSTGIATDSRKETEGKLFFALKGPNFNAHKYIEQVKAAGAHAIVIDEAEFDIYDNTILVEDVLTALQNLARHHRQELGVPVYAITGSNGKTTTKELVYRVLSQKYNVLSTKGNFNNLLGLPLTILEGTEEHEVFLLEMGSNALGEIARLCEIAQPDFGIITNIGASHLEGFGDLDGVLEEKTALYRAVSKNNGLIFVPQFSEKLRLASESNERRQLFDIGFQIGSNADCFGVEIETTVPAVKGIFHVNGIQQPFESALAGIHNAQNCAAAIVVGVTEAIAPSKIAEAIATYVPQNNRSQQIQREDYLILLDAYNANPVSMSRAMDVLKNWPVKRKFAILGDMKELGSHSSTAHDDLVRQVKNAAFENYFLVGPELRKIDEGAFTDVEALSLFLADAKLDLHDAVILIKGSRSMYLERLLDIL